MCIGFLLHFTIWHGYKEFLMILGYLCWRLDLVGSSFINNLILNNLIVCSSFEIVIIELYIRNHLVLYQSVALTIALFRIDITLYWANKLLIDLILERL